MGWVKLEVGIEEINGDGENRIIWFVKLWITINIGSAHCSGGPNLVCCLSL